MDMVQRSWTSVGPSTANSPLPSGDRASPLGSLASQGLAGQLSGFFLWSKAGPASWEHEVLRPVCQVRDLDWSQCLAFSSEPSCLERVLLSLAGP